ncbi:hypothetical protein AvCA_15170 [Azotobacter vinelandii CA]|uniref:Uncharacterized protein n=2 Tax=Azotobacter vinelandii TaxID=354 RepID=C1DRJ4_AZOVD|nr:hypothetical protein Avin_15170 [Azotobacter vinelandii DJ]AGK15301.1 hypothetical protein AvCA_15170 [Azotobacter vinelandii CA]AGK19943.1 hypothetical protein AvCA6_15170 [Azotobacter vinelandii CA6]
MFPGEGRALYIRPQRPNQCEDGNALPPRRLPEPRKAGPASVDREVACSQDTSIFTRAAGG